MKSNLIYFTALIMFAFVLTACNKDRQPDNPASFESLQVPATFTWSAVESYNLSVEVMIDAMISNKIDGSPLDLLDQAGNRIDRMTVINGKVNFFYRIPANVQTLRVYSPAANKSYDIEKGSPQLAFDISYTAVKMSGIDADGDGVDDQFDEFPHDANKAYSIQYPASKAGSYQAVDAVRMKFAAVSIVTQDFESGSRNEERTKCWQFYSTNIAGGANALNGQFSMRTGQMSSLSNTHDLISPWVALDGTGTIEFIHAINTFNGASKSLDVKLISYPDLTETNIYSFSYSNGNLSETVSIPVNVSGIYQIKWIFYGDGGNSRGLLDDIVISGEMASDPDSNNGSGVCDAVDNSGGGGNNGGGNGGGSTFPGDDNYLFQLFEDLWPSRGDYDFNDMVLASRYTIVRNGSNDIISGDLTVAVQAVGAAIESGLGFEILKSNDAHSSLTYLADVAVFSGEGIQPDPQVNNGVILFDNVRDWQSVFYSNTGGIGPDAVPDTVRMSFTLPAGTAQHIELLPYLFYAAQPEWQVRPFGVPPTAYADMNQFGSFDDASPDTWSWTAGTSFNYPLTGATAFYRTAENHPWSVEFIAASFKVPFEKTSVLVAYPQFKNWAESGGQDNATWYEFPDNAHIYVPEY